MPAVANARPAILDKLLAKEYPVPVGGCSIIESAMTLSATTGEYLLKELQAWRATRTANKIDHDEPFCSETKSESSHDDSSTNDGDELSSSDVASTASPVRASWDSNIDLLTSDVCQGGSEALKTTTVSCPTPVPMLGAEIDALIFDLDDTLYAVSTGFSEHRNAEVTVNYLVEEIGLPCQESAKQLRNEYFKRYHSTLKGLSVASKEGKLPKPFGELDLGDFWGDNCDFEKYLKPDACFVQQLESLRDDVGLELIVFTNSPRKYAYRCLDALGLRGIFRDDRVFGIEDVLPNCKPEQAAFEKILNTCGLRPERTVMFEDSMKNVKSCKAMGMHTVLINETAGCVGGEAALLDDIPAPEDPAVDVEIRRVSQIRHAVPALWSKRF